AARLVAEHDLLLTQRLILRPDIEANFYSKEDRERDIGAGLSDLAFGIRLRYEIRREIAPYLGVTFTQRMGDTADLARIAGQSSDDVRVIGGLRLWF
ncbi:MAG: copper resistance protein B, partial [Vallitaleaceae bacterium]|nr:copper resistance protein B [Vallitaleaceae bacterium]